MFSERKNCIDTQRMLSEVDRARRDASSHIETNTVGPRSDPYVGTVKIVCFIKEGSTIMQYETSQLLFVQSP